MKTKTRRKFRIGTRILCAYLIMAVLCGCIGFIGIQNIIRISQANSDLYAKDTRGISYISNAAINYQQINYNIVKLKDANNEDREGYLKKIDTSMDTANFNLLKYESLITDKNKDVYYALKDAWLSYSEKIDVIVEAAKNGVMDGAFSDAINETTAIGDQLEGTYFKQLMASVEAGAEEKSRENAKIAQDAQLGMIGVIIATFLFALLLSFIISRGFSKPIKQLSTAADKLARGDTDIKLSIRKRDEIGDLAQAFDKVVAAIRSLIDDAAVLAQAAVDGSLSVRADETKHQGDYRKIIEGVNKTLGIIIAPIAETAEVLSEISKGNLNCSLTSDFAGDYALIKESINQTVSALKGYIHEMSAVLRDIAEGTLTSYITSEYKGDFSELKQSINAILDSLNNLLGDISLSADQVASGTRQISDGNQIISQGAAEQASSIDELTATITQIAAKTKQNALNANKANDISAAVRDEAVKGNEQMMDMQNAMTDMMEASANISKVIKVIDDIAFQTNILALNAAVEAARAGIHGRGFAVVAGEVRNLAMKCAEAAKETTEMIESSANKTQAGSKLADRTAQALAGIVDGVEKTVELVAEIAAASNEQATGIAQVNGGMDQLYQVVQTNSATAQEAAASSEELSGQVDLLRDMVGRFQLKSGESKQIEQTGYKQYRLNEESGNAALSLDSSEFGKY